MTGRSPRPPADPNPGDPAAYSTPPLPLCTMVHERLPMTVKTRRRIGIGTAIQGAVLAAVSLQAVPAALRIAEILYAEDFDRAGFVPWWFQPWHLAMWHPGTTVAILFVSSAALGMTGIGFARQTLSAR